MDVSAALNTVLSRQGAESAARVAELRVQRMRDAAHPPVKYGEAEQKKRDPEPVDPVAVTDSVKDKNLGALADLTV